MQNKCFAISEWTGQRLLWCDTCCWPNNGNEIDGKVEIRVLNAAA